MDDLVLFIDAVKREHARLREMNQEAQRQLRASSPNDETTLSRLPGVMDVLIKTDVSMCFRNLQKAKLQTELGVLALGNTDAFTEAMMRAMHPYAPPGTYVTPEGLQDNVLVVCDRRAVPRDT